ncbi:hypothetical protein NQZ68_033310 [Dissostichus eleginoides]|nr:hypothetical protein NQZ68_033310 [Dissostichus eleginoides]
MELGQVAFGAAVSCCLQRPRMSAAQKSDLPPSAAVCPVVARRQKASRTETGEERQRTNVGTGVVIYMCSVRLHYYLFYAARLSDSPRENKSFKSVRPAISYLHARGTKALSCCINKPQQRVGVYCCKRLRMGREEKRSAVKNIKGCSMLKPDSFSLLKQTEQSTPPSLSLAVTLPPAASQPPGTLGN